MFFKRLRKSARGNGQPSPMDAPPSYIGQEVVVEGSLVSAGELHIDGTVHGNARAQAVMVDRHGAVHGEVAGEEVLVRGRVIGPIRGVHVHLYPGAHVEGDVINETISIDHGAYIYGSIRRSEDPLAEPGQQQYRPKPPAQIEKRDDLDVLDEDNLPPAVRR
ncbi:MAG: polymer-forming cytoskeletal protein [Hyphomicrobiales bacterium]